MANYSAIKAAVNAYIKANGKKEITGHILNSVLNATIDSLGKEFQFKGVLTPADDPGQPDQNVAYIGAAGTYPNFDSLVIASGTIGIFMWNGDWSFATIPVGKDYDNDIQSLTQGLQELYENIQELSDDVIHLDGINEEDLSIPDGGKLQFANRVYNAQQPDGMGYVILRKNKTFAEQVTKANTIYEIRYAFDLSGASVSLPAGCVLYFNGGKLENGTLVGNGTKVVAANYTIFAPGVTKYRGYTLDGYKYVSRNTGGIILSGSWSNDHVGSLWTGMSASLSCASDAINNYIKLHRAKAEITFPGGITFYVYATMNVQDRNVDFNNCTFKLPDYSTIEDATIPIPDGGVARAMRHPGVIVACGGNGSVVKNLTIDEDATTRNEEPEVLGSLFSVSYVASSVNCTIENFTIKNAVCCGIQETKTCHDNTLRNVEFNMIGEHAIYSLAYVGVSKFYGCKFINVGQSAWVFSQRGMSACIRNSIISPEFEVRTLKVYCENCLFKVDASKNVMTTYYDAPVMEFVSCTWEGSLMYGYRGYRSNSSPAMDRVEKRIFRNCTNPAGLYSPADSFGVVRELYNCDGVRHPFVDTNIIENCKCPLGRTDDYNTIPSGFESEYKNPIIVRNTDFYTDADSGTAGYYIMKNTLRSVIFENCLIDIQKTGNPALLTLQGDSSQMDVVFIGCKVNTANSMLIRTTTGIQTKSLQITSCVINGIGTWLNDADTALFLFRGNTTIAYAYEKLIRAASAWVVEGNYSNYESRNNYHRVTYVSLKDGETYNLAGVFNAVGIPASVDLLKYVKVTPQGGATELYTYSIANNTPNQSVLTLSGPTTARTYKVEIDLTRYPL